ncbi:threonine-phosphate decarboxylase [Anoxybacillus tepidamans]|uniref:threonine-phosphate decarboxylase n=1 Tax=Anoxybacteroides tepidamans TaxID=265948 RepID=A0A7W8IMV5_9BACL|nr:threonine-phosphate decarboxylase CobD [Anoxybacillus tepidamans]MBB5323465.1 threonine-phosphate decarboxylase [Anoxybacillus tepidamans]
MNWPSHGANPYKLYKSLDLPFPDVWIDFSVNTNPYSLPLSLWPTQADFCRWATEYPDPDASELINYLSRTERLSSEQLLIGSGASQCIDLLARLFSGKRVGIFEPTFSEYRRACEANRCTIVSIVSDEQRDWAYDQQQLLELVEQVDVLFLCHPNNPTGTVMKKEQLYSLLEAAEQAGTFVVIDEAFYHFWNGAYTALEWISSFSRLIVIRSLTKMYHLAGVRIGYIAANEAVVQKLKAFQPPWSVGQVAQKLALHFLPMNEFVVHARWMIDHERKRITAVLQKAGYYVSPSVVNFYLLRAPHQSAEKLLYDLLREGLIPRHTKNFRGLDGHYLRLAVKTKGENDQLLSFLTRWLS